MGSRVDYVCDATLVTNDATLRSNTIAKNAELLRIHLECGGIVASDKKYVEALPQPEDSLDVDYVAMKEAEAIGWKSHHHHNADSEAVALFVISQLSNVGSRERMVFALTGRAVRPCHRWHVLGQQAWAGYDPRLIISLWKTIETTFCQATADSVPAFARLARAISLSGIRTDRIGALMFVLGHTERAREANMRNSIHFIKLLTKRCPSNFCGSDAWYAPTNLALAFAAIDNASAVLRSLSESELSDLWLAVLASSRFRGRRFFDGPETVLPCALTEDEYGELILREKKKSREAALAAAAAAASKAAADAEAAASAARVNDARSLAVSPPPPPNASRLYPNLKPQPPRATTAMFGNDAVGESDKGFAKHRTTRPEPRSPYPISAGADKIRDLIRSTIQTTGPIGLRASATTLAAEKCFGEILKRLGFEYAPGRASKAFVCMAVGASQWKEIYEHEFEGDAALTGVVMGLEARASSLMNVARAGSTKSVQTSCTSYGTWIDMLAPLANDAEFYRLAKVDDVNAYFDDLIKILRPFALKCDCMLQRPSEIAAEALAIFDPLWPSLWSARSTYLASIDGPRNAWRHDANAIKEIEAYRKSFPTISDGEWSGPEMPVKLRAGIIALMR